MLVDGDPRTCWERREQVPGGLCQFGRASARGLFCGECDEVLIRHVHRGRGSGSVMRRRPYRYQLPCLVVGRLERDEAGWLAVDRVHRIGLEHERVKLAPLCERAVGEGACGLGGRCPSGAEGVADAFAQQEDALHGGVVAHDDVAAGDQLE